MAVEMAERYRVEAHNERKGRSSWLVRVMRGEDLVQVVARGLTRQDAMVLVEPVMFAFESGAREATEHFRSEAYSYGVRCDRTEDGAG